MKLDRNINPDGRNKYAILKLRKQEKPFTPECQQAAMTLRDAGLLDFGNTEGSEFFVIKLKDKYAAVALAAYAMAAHDDDPEYSGEVMKLAKIAAKHPNKHKPD